MDKITCPDCKSEDVRYKEYDTVYDEYVWFCNNCHSYFAY